MTSQKRQFYRITYISTQAPELTVAGKTFQVVDVSEEGLKFKLTPNHNPSKGAVIRGRIQFKNGDSINIEGKVIRIIGRECVVQLKTGVPLGTIMSEQQRLIRVEKGDE